MTPRLRYRGTSGVDVRLDTASVGLATHADAQQGYLSATLVRVDVLRDVLRAAHALAWSDPPTEAPRASRDAWFSVFDDVVFVEVPAPDGSAWLRMRLARALFAQARDVATGTTTLRLPWSLGRELRRLSPARSTSFVASPGGSDPAIDGSILDDHAALPNEAAWSTALRLAGGTRATASTATTLPPSALVRPLTGLVVGGVGAPLVVPADPPWRGTPVVVAGGARVRALAPLLAHARRVAVDVDGEVVTLDGEHVTATLTLAGAAHDDRNAPLADDAASPGLLVGAAFIDVDGARRQRPLAMPDAR